MSDDAKFAGTEKSMVLWETIGWLGLMGLGLMHVIDRVQVYQGFSDGSLCDEWEWSHNLNLRSGCYCRITALDGINTCQLCRAGTGVPEMVPNAGLL